MDKYNLLPDEAVLVEIEDVHRKSKKIFQERGNLVLTNYNLIFAIKGGLTGSIKSLEKHPLRDIKVFREEAQVKYEKKFGEDAVLSVFLKNDSFSFVSAESGKLKDIVNEVNRLVTGSEKDVIFKKAIPGVGALAETIKDTAGSFVKGLGYKKKEKELAVICTACNGSFTGIKGKMATCPYCGKKVNL